MKTFAGLQIEYGLSVATSSTPPSGATWCIQRRTTGSVVSLALRSTGRSTLATPANARSRVATSATTLSTFTPWATSLARSGSRSIPLSSWSQSPPPARWSSAARSEEHTSELQSRLHLVCRLLLEKKKQKQTHHIDITAKATSIYRSHGTNVILKSNQTNVSLIQLTHHGCTQY